MAAWDHLRASTRARGVDGAVFGLYRDCLELGGYVVLTVKANHPTLYADLATYFANPYACYEQSITSDDRLGRIEIHRIKVSSEMTTYLTGLTSPRWPNSVAQ
jgi:hypothetical protein